MTQNEQKKMISQFAVDNLIERKMIFSGMKIGLGTGSTAKFVVEYIGEKLQKKELTSIFAVTTSFQTTIACQNLHIPIFSLNDPEISGELDLTIDGADEFSSERNLIKGGGAALLKEKIVAYNSKKFVIVADSTKFNEQLGTKFRVPIEIIADSRVSVCNALKNLGATAILREGVKKAGPVVTDNGNLILDALWEKSPNPSEMEKKLNEIVGVVENGFFTQKKPIIFYCDKNEKPCILE